MYPGDLEPVLEVDLMCAVGVIRRQLPAPRPPARGGTAAGSNAAAYASRTAAMPSVHEKTACAAADDTKTGTARGSPFARLIVPTICGEPIAGSFLPKEPAQ